MKVIYGLEGQIPPLTPMRMWLGCWNGLIRMLAIVNDRGFDFQALSPIRIGDGAYTYFWNDVWLGDTLLVMSFHRLYAMDNHRTTTVRDHISFG